MAPTTSFTRTRDAAPRRLTAKGEATRARIVEAASGLVFAHGVTRTGVEDVQREAGVSASQLYHYFGDKQTLMRAVIAHQTAAILAAQQPELDALESFEALGRWRDRLVTLQRLRHCVGGCPIGSIAAAVRRGQSPELALRSCQLEWSSALSVGERHRHDHSD